MRHLLPAALLAPFLSCATPEVATEVQDGDGGYVNLQVLPADTPRDELGDLMLDFLSGLGLPRRAGAGCLHCHEGSLDVPRRDWDYASDAKPAKAQARKMLAMVRAINDTHLAQLDPRPDPESRVTCYTCHAGRLNPMPLEDLLRERFDEGGADAVGGAYRELRARYYAGDAYDFRVWTLSGLATEIASEGDFESASAIHHLNAEHHSGDASAAGGIVHVALEETLRSRGVDAMVARYHELKDELEPFVFVPSLLDPLAWRLFRADDQEAGFRLMELNHAEHPEAFVTVEGLAWGAFSMGDRERALALAEAWVAEHPEHESGRLMRDEMLRRSRE